MKTAESVSPKHPDKMCDQISDAILDWCLSKDPKARVAIETMGGHGQVFIVGELTMKGYSTSNTFEDGITQNDLDAVLKNIVERIAGAGLELHWNIAIQSPEIASGVDTGGAGDQGIMVGFACDETPEMVPREYFLARSLCKYFYKQFPYDGKTQITLGNSGRVQTIVASFQNVPAHILRQVTQDWYAEISGITDTSEHPEIYANPAGNWEQGGFDADTGLTGRKLMVDNYGPQVSIGGGAFSGKDASKVDRSAAYMARRIAVDILKRQQAKKVVVKLAYAIGVAEPVMAIATVTTKGYRGGPTTNYKIDLLHDKEMFAYDLTPKGIREYLKLDAPQYEETAKWGHFGQGFTWDR